MTLRMRVVLALIAWLLRRLPDGGRRFKLIDTEAQAVAPVPALPAIQPAVSAAPTPLPELPSMAAQPVVLTVLAGPPAVAARFQVIARSATSQTNVYSGDSGATARDAYMSAHSDTPMTVELWDGAACRGRRTNTNN